jgi:RNA polymerase sigma-70 factor, ECF subfamily
MILVLTGARRLVVMSWNRETVSANRHANELEQDDRLLAERARHSTDAFGTLYERYLDGIYAYCLRRVDRQQVAEDLTATVFERALAGIDSFRGMSFRAWLFRIAHNAVTDHYRRRRDLISWQPEMSGPDDDPSPEEYAIKREERAQLQSFLSGLTDDQRRVVELRLAGLTGAEIAEVVGRSSDAVKMLQFRALERMRNQIPANPANAESTDE